MNLIDCDHGTHVEPRDVEQRVDDAFEPLRRLMQTLENGAYAGILRLRLQQLDPQSDRLNRLAKVVTRLGQQARRRCWRGNRPSDA